jgi:hypothetical protein
MCAKREIAESRPGSGEVKSKNVSIETPHRGLSSPLAEYCRAPRGELDCGAGVSRAVWRVGKVRVDRTHDAVELFAEPVLA